MCHIYEHLVGSPGNSLCIFIAQLSLYFLQVFVWHVKTQKPWILFEANNPTDDNYEV